MKVEEITAAIAANPELKTALIGSLENDVLEVVKGKGLTVRTKDEETIFLNNYEANVLPTKVQAQIGEKIKAVHDQYDNDIFELTGLKKGSTEKTYEFNKRVLKELKEKSEKAGANGDQVLKDQVKQMELKLKERENYVAPEEVEKIKGAAFSERIVLRLGTTLEKKAIAVPAHITDEKAKQSYIERQRQFIKNDFLSRYTAKQNDKGEVVYYEGDTLQNDSKTAAPLTEEQLIEKNYQDYFVPAKKATGGAGSGNGGQGSDVDVNEATLKTKAEVITHLKSKGMVAGGVDFNKEYVRILKEYGITEPGE